VAENDERLAQERLEVFAVRGRSSGCNRIPRILRAHAEAPKRIDRVRLIR
jgi:hypothetical protein